jgi:SAM-dependent methyltransferase
MQLQISTETARSRYPALFAFVAERLHHQGRVLSFGCSEGHEVFTLAHDHFDRSIIVGIDVNRDALDKARQILEDPAAHGYSIRGNTISFHENNGADLGRFDCIFAMSVLCRHPAPRNIRREFPYARFTAALRQIDKALKPGGYLVLFNTAYRFENTKVARGYVALATPPMDRRNPFVAMFHEDGTRDEGPTPAIVFRKRSALGTWLQRTRGRIERRVSSAFRR